MLPEYTGLITRSKYCPIYLLQLKSIYKANLIIMRAFDLSILATLANLLLHFHFVCALYGVNVYSVDNDAWDAWRATAHQNYRFVMVAYDDDDGHRCEKPLTNDNGTRQTCVLPRTPGYSMLNTSYAECYGISNNVEVIVADDGCDLYFGYGHDIPTIWQPMAQDYLREYCVVRNEHKFGDTDKLIDGVHAQFRP